MSSEQKGVLLFDILTSFKAPLSEEQAWAVCFQSVKTIISETHGASGFGSPTCPVKHIDIKLITTQVLKDGSVRFLNTTESPTPQKDSELLHSLGKVIYECLDYGMEVCMERQLDPALENLILDMACENGDTRITSVGGEEEASHNNLRTRGFTGKDAEHSSSENRNQEIWEEVMARCLAHLPSATMDLEGHFRAVCRALVDEALQLNAFLQQLYNGHAFVHCKSGSNFGSTNWGYLHSLQAAEWAKLWLQVMEQLREGVSLRHVVNSKLPPASFELTPYEMLLDDIRYKRYNLSHVTLSPSELKGKKSARELILEFIRSRPPLSKTSSRRLEPRQATTPTLHDMLLREIHSRPKLRSCPEPTVKSARELYLEEMIGTSADGSSTRERPKRRCLKPANKLTELISHWDSPPSTDQSMDELDPSPLTSRSSTPRLRHSSALDKNAQPSIGVVKRSLSDLSCSSLELDDSGESFIKNCYFSHTLGARESDGRPIFPPSLRAIETLDVTSKIYMSLEEVKHMRSTLTKLDLESLDPDERTYKELANGRLCFCCRKRKFSLLGNWSRVCEICECRVCYYCIHKVDSSSSYLFQDDEEYNHRDSGIGDMWSWTSYLSMSMSAAAVETKTRKICVACRRFINMHC